MIKVPFKQWRNDYDDLMYAAVDADDGAAVAAGCGVAVYPTFQVYRGTTKVDELRGADTKAIEELIARHSGRGVTPLPLDKSGCSTASGG